MTNQSDRPAVDGIVPGHFAPPPVEPGHTAPCPRRIRAMIGDEWVIDSSAVQYYWEHPYYPRYLIPLTDIHSDALPVKALKTLDDTTLDHRLVNWRMIDRWFEEDEEVFAHPRSPYARVDAIRSNRQIRVQLPDVTLAEASTCVIVFETGLPPRYYLDKTAINWSLLTPSDTVTECPYKGTTSNFWNTKTGNETTNDIAWSYDFPTRTLAPIAGLVAFYDEKLHITVD